MPTPHLKLALAGLVLALCGGSASQQARPRTLRCNPCSPCVLAAAAAPTPLHACRSNPPSCLLQFSGGPTSRILGSGQVRQVWCQRFAALSVWLHHLMRCVLHPDLCSSRTLLQVSLPGGTRAPFGTTPANLCLAVCHSSTVTTSALVCPSGYSASAVVNGVIQRRAPDSRCWQLFLALRPAAGQSLAGKLCLLPEPQVACSTVQVPHSSSLLLLSNCRCWRNCPSPYTPGPPPGGNPSDPPSWCQIDTQHCPSGWVLYGTDDTTDNAITCRKE